MCALTDFLEVLQEASLALEAVRDLHREHALLVRIPRFELLLGVVDHLIRTV
jgi:hypothetical protein